MSLGEPSCETSGNAQNGASHINIRGRPGQVRYNNTLKPEKQVNISVTALRKALSCKQYLYFLYKFRWSCSWAVQSRHNERDGVSNHQPHECLFSRLFRRRSKKTSKLRVTGLFAGNSPVTGEFPAQKVSNAENVSTWWRHHGKRLTINQL